MNGIGFSTSAKSERLFGIAARDILEIYMSPAWPSGIYVQTLNGPLAFGVSDPHRWVTELARLRGVA